MPVFSQQEINASSESLLTVLRVSNGLNAMAATGKGAAISLGLPGAEYSTKIATIFEQSNPSYLNPALAFFTMHNSYLAGSEVERMRISSIGYVGIGTIIPGSPLHVQSDQAFNGETGQLRLSPTTNPSKRLYMGFDNTADIGYIQSLHSGVAVKSLVLQAKGGNVGIGTIIPGSPLHVQSDQTFNGETGQLRLSPTTNPSKRLYMGFDNAADIGYIQAVHSGVLYKNIVLQASGGRVGIGTVNVSDDSYKLFVELGIRTRKIKIDAVAWPDYVFEEKYNLLPLEDLEKFIKANKHLPDMPSATEVKKNGIDLGDNQTMLLQKIEELTLYAIEQNKKINELIVEVSKLKTAQKK